MTTKQLTLKPEPEARLATDADNVTRTDAYPVSEEARALYEAVLLGPASDEADDLVIVLQVRERLTRAADAAYWTPLGDVIRESGLDPADYGLE